MTAQPDDQLLRDADPYRPVVARDLDEAAHQLLEQIVAEPTGRRPLYLYAAAAVAVAAAVLVAVIVVPQAWKPAPAPPAATVAPSASPSVTAPASATPPPPGSSLLEPSKVRKAAKESPRIIVSEPGWKVIHLEPFGDRMGEMAYEKGELSFDQTWYPAAQYSSRRNDRQANNTKVKVGDLTGYLRPISKNDFSVATEPHDGVFAVLRAGTGWTRATWEALVARLRHVDEAAWVASVSPQVTSQGEAGDRAARLLLKMPAPPDWDPDQMDGFPTTDTKLFDAALVKLITCGWLKEWQRAKATGNTDALNRAATSLLSSEDWPVLAEQADLRQQITTIAGRVASGQSDDAEIENYRQDVC